jgi:hypothetical protein
VVICCYLTARRYFLFAATQLHMPFNPAAHANANENGMCSWGFGPNRMQMRIWPRLKAGGLIGLRDAILYKRVEVFLEALGAFVLCVLMTWS